MEKGFSRSHSVIGHVLALGLVAGIGSMGVGATPAWSAPRGSQPSQAPESVPGEMLVKVKDQASFAGQSFQSFATSQLARVLGAGSVQAVKPLQTDRSVYKIKLTRKSDLTRALGVLRSDSAVEIAEPNYLYRASVTERAAPTNDPEFSKLWGIQNVGQPDYSGQIGRAGSDINVVPLWEQGFKGSHQMKVAVIDTGVQWDHPDLVDNIYTNPGEAGPLASNGIDDDGNGFVDDVHGWNFVNNTRDSNDDHDHGTHCAGTIAARGNNGTGVVGVNWEASIVPIKFLSASGGGSLEGAIEGINYARKLGVQIMSNSWGGGGYSEILKQAIVAAKNAGVLFVAAAGNDAADNDGSPMYPASYDVENVLAVAATDNLDNLASFSNYGATKVHVAAPGVNIFSTVRRGLYGKMSGTSMATPHVSGIAALLWSANDGWDFNEVKSRLIRTSDPVRGLRRKVVAKGRVNATLAMHNIVPPSNEPDESLWQTELRAVESEHPYKDHEGKTYVVQVPGAKFIRVIFDKVEVERNYDRVYVQDGSGQAVESLTGTYTNYPSEFVEGDTVKLRLESDESQTYYGFKVSKVQVIR